jgi:hypothetical protein
MSKNPFVFLNLRRVRFLNKKDRFIKNRNETTFILSFPHLLAGLQKQNIKKQLHRKEEEQCCSCQRSTCGIQN